LEFQSRAKGKRKGGGESREGRKRKRRGKDLAAVGDAVSAPWGIPYGRVTRVLKTAWPHGAKQSLNILC